jgi:hypothetical protein
LFVRSQRKTYRNIVLFIALFVSIFDLFLANYGFFSSVSWKWFIAKEGLIKEIPSGNETGRYFVTVKTES